MSPSGSPKRRVDARRLPEEEFAGAVNLALKEGDAAAVLAWAESLAGDLGVSSRLLGAWTAALKNPAATRDPSALLWPLAALRKGLQREHLEGLAAGSSRLLRGDAPIVWSSREDDLARAILCLALEDVEGEKVNLARYLESGRDYRSFRMANLFALLGTPNMDVVRAHFAPRGAGAQERVASQPALLFDVGDGLAAKFARSKTLRRAASRGRGNAGSGVGRTGSDLPRGGARVHTPPVVDVERSKEEGEHLGEDPARIATRRGRKKSASADGRPSIPPTDGSPVHQDAPIDLKREFFSRGPEVARALLLEMAAEMASRYPGVGDSIKVLLVEAIDSAEPNVDTSPRPMAERSSQKGARPARMAELPERTGDPLIQNVATLWDRRGSISRREFVEGFQTVLDEFHERKSLGSYEADETLTSWIKKLARAERIKLMLCLDNSNYIAVTIRCLERRESGYFVPRTASRNPSVVKGRSSPSFPKLVAVSL